MRQAADRSLAEVRRKVTDAKQLVDTFKALTKLRELRKDAAKRKGMLSGSLLCHLLSDILILHPCSAFHFCFTSRHRCSFYFLFHIQAPMFLLFSVSHPGTDVPFIFCFTSRHRCSFYFLFHIQASMFLLLSVSHPSTDVPFIFCFTSRYRCSFYFLFHIQAPMYLLFSVSHPGTDVPCSFCFTSRH